MQMCRLITGEERNELDMVFSFDHLETPGHTRFEDYEYDLNYLRDYMIDWTQNYGNNCWMSIFYNNHDNPRMVSKIKKDKKYHTQIKRLLAVIQFTLRGTPFVFQGDEIGLENYDFNSIDQINDVESRNLYIELCKKMDEKLKPEPATTHESCFRLKKTNVLLKTNLIHRIILKAIVIILLMLFSHSSRQIKRYSKRTKHSYSCEKIIMSLSTVILNY